MKFIKCLYMFRALCAHHQDVKIVLYSIWFRRTCRSPSGAQVERVLFQPAMWWYQMLYNTILTFWWWAQQCSKHVEAYNKLIIKIICALSWLITKIKPNFTVLIKKVAAIHATKTHCMWGVEAQLHSFLTSTLDGSEWSTSQTHPLYT